MIYRKRLFGFAAKTQKHKEVAGKKRKRLSVSTAKYLREKISVNIA